MPQQRAPQTQDATRIRDFEFETAWVIPAPMGPVWEHLSDISTYPRWWDNWSDAERRSGPLDGDVGTVYDCDIHGFLPVSIEFSLKITELTAYESLRYQCSGDLIGEGGWTFHQEEKKTFVTSYWNVNLSDDYPDMLTWPLVRWILKKNYDYVMNQGYQELKEQVNRP